MQCERALQEVEVLQTGQSRRDKTVINIAKPPTADVGFGHRRNTINSRLSYRSFLVSSIKFRN